MREPFPHEEITEEQKQRFLEARSKFVAFAAERELLADMRENIIWMKTNGYRDEAIDFIEWAQRELGVAA